MPILDDDFVTTLRQTNDPNHSLLDDSDASTHDQTIHLEANLGCLILQALELASVLADDANDVYQDAHSNRELKAF